MTFQRLLGGLAVGWLCAAGACITDERGSQERGAAKAFTTLPIYRAPSTTRCNPPGAPGLRARGCDEAKYLGEIHVRRLATGDAVCLEGGFGEPPSGACLCRAAVIDTAPNRVLLEVREARPDSKWFNREQHQFWFEEGALVDLYLAEHGY